MSRSMTSQACRPDGAGCWSGRSVPFPDRKNQASAGECPLTGRSGGSFVGILPGQGAMPLSNSKGGLVMGRRDAGWCSRQPTRGGGAGSHLIGSSDSPLPTLLRHRMRRNFMAIQEVRGRVARDGLPERDGAKRGFSRKADALRNCGHPRPLPQAEGAFARSASEEAAMAGTVFPPRCWYEPVSSRGSGPVVVSLTRSGRGRNAAPTGKDTHGSVVPPWLAWPLLYSL